jgi:hypothetical protein
MSLPGSRFNSDGTERMYPDRYTEPKKPEAPKPEEPEEEAEERRRTQSEHLRDQRFDELYQHFRSERNYPNLEAYEKEAENLQLQGKLDGNDGHALMQAYAEAAIRFIHEHPLEELPLGAKQAIASNLIYRKNQGAHGELDSAMGKELLSAAKFKSLRHLITSMQVGNRDAASAQTQEDQEEFLAFLTRVKEKDPNLLERIAAKNKITKKALENINAKLDKHPHIGAFIRTNGISAIGSSIGVASAIAFGGPIGWAVVGAAAARIGIVRIQSGLLATQRDREDLVAAPEEVDPADADPDADPAAAAPEAPAAAKRRSSDGYEGVRELIEHTRKAAELAEQLESISEHTFEGNERNALCESIAQRATQLAQQAGLLGEDKVEAAARAKMYEAISAHATQLAKDSGQLALDVSTPEYAGVAQDAARLAERVKQDDARKAEYAAVSAGVADLARQVTLLGPGAKDQAFQDVSRKISDLTRKCAVLDPVAGGYGTAAGELARIDEEIQLLMAAEKAQGKTVRSALALQQARQQVEDLAADLGELGGLVRELEGTQLSVQYAGISQEATSLAERAGELSGVGSAEDRIKREAYEKLADQMIATLREGSFKKLQKCQDINTVATIANVMVGVSGLAYGLAQAGAHFAGHAADGARGVAGAANTGTTQLTAAQSVTHVRSPLAPGDARLTSVFGPGHKVIGYKNVLDDETLRVQVGHVVKKIGGVWKYAIEQKDLKPVMVHGKLTPVHLQGLVEGHGTSTITAQSFAHKAAGTTYWHDFSPAEHHHQAALLDRMYTAGGTTAKALPIEQAWQLAQQSRIDTFAAASLVALPAIGTRSLLTDLRRGAPQAAAETGHFSGDQDGEGEYASQIPVDSEADATESVQPEMSPVRPVESAQEGGESVPPETAPTPEPVMASPEAPVGPIALEDHFAPGEHPETFVFAQANKSVFDWLNQSLFDLRPNAAQETILATVRADNYETVVGQIDELNRAADSRLLPRPKFQIVMLRSDQKEDSQKLEEARRALEERKVTVSPDESLSMQDEAAVRDLMGQLSRSYAAKQDKGTRVLEAQEQRATESV